jgi:fructose-bisphosphate aldolase, class II
MTSATLDKNETVQGLLRALDQALAVTPGGKVRVQDEAKLTANIRALAEKSAFGSEAEQAAARWLVWEAAMAIGVFPASIQGLYAARGRGETPVHFTVPAMNLRAMTFDSARAVFRAAKALDAGAFIFEIARSEMTYTQQRPTEYVTSVLAAAIHEGYRGPVFIQGDHFQINLKKYKANPEAEVKAVKDLIVEAVGAGFYNIDVDSSTLVDLSLATIPEQQRENAQRCAELTAFIRATEPKGVTISVGGEIGEVGSRNSTEVELRAFMDNYNALLLEQTVNGRRSRNLTGLSKISIQTGTSHGGVVLPDGSMAEVAVDFDVLKRLSQVARKEYGMAGAVQHGASTLPESAFSKFAESEACEVHLATNFMNMLYAMMPAALREEVYAWLRVNQAGDRKATDTDEQFFYKTRKQAIGAFKQQVWGLAEEERQAIGAAWEKQFAFLFTQLGISNTYALVQKTVEPVSIHKSLADYGLVEKEAEDVSGLSD